MGKIWLYSVQDKTEKFKRYRRKIMKVIQHNDEYRKLDDARMDHLAMLALIDSDDQCANLIRYMDAFLEEEKQCFCIVFQNFKLNTLEEKISSREFDFRPTSIVNWAIQILKGVEFLHDRGIIHYDVTPKNIYMTPRNHAVVGDIALAVPSLELYVTERSGTLNYMAPEVVNGQISKMSEEEREKADVWSIGCIFYELIYLEKAFDNEDLRALAMSIVNCQVDLPEFIEETLCYFLNHTLAKDHRNRSTAKKLLYYLEDRIDYLFDRRPELDEANACRLEAIKDKPKMECLATITAHGAEITSTCTFIDSFSKKELLVSVAKDRYIKVWSVETGDPLRALSIEEDEPTSIVVLNQSVLLLGSVNHNKLKTWKIDSGIQYDDLPVDKASKIYAMLVYRDSKVIVATNRNFQIRQINIGPVLTSTLVSLYEGHDLGVRCMAYFENQDNLITGGVDGTVRFWNLDTKKCYRKLFGHEKAVLAIVVIDIGKIITSSADCTIIVWNVRNGEALRTLSEHTDWVNSMVLRQNRLISCSDDHTIRVWNINTRECEKIMSDHGNNVLSLLVAKNGVLVSASCDGMIKIWN